MLGALGALDAVLAKPEGDAGGAAAGDAPALTVVAKQLHSLARHTFETTLLLPGPIISARRI